MDNRITAALSRKFANTARDNPDRTVSELRDNVFKRMKASRSSVLAPSNDNFVTPILSSLVSQQSKFKRDVDKKVTFLDKKYTDAIKAMDTFYMSKFDDYDQKFLKIKRCFKDLGVDLDKISPGHLTYAESLKKIKSPANINSSFGLKDRIGNTLRDKMPITMGMWDMMKTAAEFLIDKKLLELGLVTAGTAAAGVIGGAAALTRGAVRGAGALARTVGSAAIEYGPAMARAAIPAATSPVGITVGAIGLSTYGVYRSISSYMNASPEERARRDEAIKNSHKGRHWTGRGWAIDQPSDQPSRVVPQPPKDPAPKEDPKAIGVTPKKDDFSEKIIAKVAEYTMESLADISFKAKKKITLKGEELELDFKKITFKGAQAIPRVSSPKKTGVQDPRKGNQTTVADPYKNLKKGDAVDKDADLNDFEQQNGLGGFTQNSDGSYNLPSVDTNMSSGPGSSSSSSSSDVATPAPQTTVSVNPTGSAGIRGNILRGDKRSQQQGYVSVNGASDPFRASKRAGLAKGFDALSPSDKAFIYHALKAEGNVHTNLEQLSNYAEARGMTLMQALHSGQFGPVNHSRISSAPLNANQQKEWDTAVKSWRSGSNVIGDRTDQGMVGDPNYDRELRDPRRRPMNNGRSSQSIFGDHPIFDNYHKSRKSWYQLRQEEEARFKIEHPEAYSGDASNLQVPSSGNGPREGSAEFWNSTRLASGQDASIVPNGNSVHQLQDKIAATRKGQLQGKLVDQLNYAAAQSNVQVEVFSGGQRMEGAPGATGSHRHDHGGAADVKLYRVDKDGKKHYLSMNNPEDRVIMGQFIKDSVKAGATGVGSAEGYMGESGIHIGGGEPSVWGVDGRSANAPDWVRKSFEIGREENKSFSLSEWKRNIQKQQAASIPKSNAGQKTILFAHGMMDRYNGKDPKELEDAARRIAAAQGAKLEVITDKNGNPISGSGHSVGSPLYNALTARLKQGGVTGVIGFSAGANAIAALPDDLKKDLQYVNAIGGNVPLNSSQFGGKVEQTPSINGVRHMDLVQTVAGRYAAPDQATTASISGSGETTYFGQDGPSIDYGKGMAPFLNQKSIADQTLGWRGLQGVVAMKQYEKAGIDGSGKGPSRRYINNPATREAIIGEQAQSQEDAQAKVDWRAEEIRSSYENIANRIETEQAMRSADDLKPRDLPRPESNDQSASDAALKPINPQPTADPKPNVNDHIERPIHDPEKEDPSPGSDGYGRGNQGNSDSIN